MGSKMFPVRAWVCPARTNARNGAPPVGAALVTEGNELSQRRDALAFQPARDAQSKPRSDRMLRMRISGGQVRGFSHYAKRDSGQLRSAMLFDRRAQVIGEHRRGVRERHQRI